MTKEEIKNIFENNKSEFLKLKEHFEKKVIREEYSKCPFYEITPYSYQRSGFKQGEIVSDFKNIKSKDLFIYGFNNENQLTTIKQGLEIKNQFYYQFRIVYADFIKIFNFNNNSELRSVKVLFLNKDNLIEKSLTHAKFGAREEFFLYNEDNKLAEIQVIPYGEGRRRRGKVEPYKEIFSYNDNDLEKITKVFENGYSEVLYENSGNNTD